MVEIYDLFVARVAQGRGLPVESVGRFAEGRIFSGREGKKRGLSAERGGLSEAIARARTLAGLPADASASTVGDSTGLLQALVQEEAELRTDSVPTRLGAIAPDLLPFVASIAPIGAYERALCAMPFALTVR